MKPETSVVVPEVSIVVALGRKILGWIGFGDANYKMRENAVNWLELAERVYHFRRDVLPAAQVSELQAHIASLKALIKQKAGAEKLKLEIEATEEVLRRTGGAIYPKSALVENVEFFLVAAIVILGIRTYFVQPFKIPTNSMWPTYNGMTTEVFKKVSDEPSKAAVAFRTVAYGAWPHRLDAPMDGEVLIPKRRLDQTRGLVYNREVAGRTWLVIPTTVREYTLIVGDAPVTVKLPQDFDFDWVLSEGLLAPDKPYSNLTVGHFLEQAERQYGTETRMIDGNRVECIRTGRRVKAGERFLSFDELTGDQLFVDRVSYHFIRPSPGEGFVFRTGNIAGIARDYGDQYYIKRLVAGPGDEVEIVPGKVVSDGALSMTRVPTGVLMRNGKPIEGATAFKSNNEQKDGYKGYFAMGLLSPGEKLKIPKDHFFALGDNSANSADGRYWGFVPGKDVAGRPLFIYFPFTKHWGPAP